MTPPDEHRPSAMTAPEYWRSIAHLEQDPAVRAHYEREFPEGITETDSTVSRRTFLGLMGASTALAGLTGCRRPEERIVPYVSKPEELTLGIAQRYATSMPFGTDPLPLLVHSHEGRPTHVAGNPMHPATAGAVNVWAAASILELYDPDRSQVVRQAGQPTTFDAFLGAWSAARATLMPGGGAGLALLLEPYASPTVHRLVAEFRAAWPKALVATWEPVGDEQIREGLRIALGTAADPVYDFSAADVVVSVDADILGTESRPVRNTRGFSARRRPATAADGMNRLYLVESTLSQTAVMADHRMTVASSQIGAVTAALTRALAARGVALPGLDLDGFERHPFDPAWIEAAADDLVRARGRGLVIAGRRQPPQVHALVAALNAALGHQGRTVTYRIVPHSSSSDPSSFAALTAAMKRGSISTLVVVGSNPVYTAPSDADFAALLSGVGTTIHLGHYHDETGSKCTWHIPRAHALESWGDVADIDGRLGVVQPLIAPLFGGISDVEFLAVLSGGVPVKAYDAVRTTWSALLPAAGFDAAFRTVLHDGTMEGPVTEVTAPVNLPSVASALAGAPFTLEAPRAGRMEVVFTISPAVHDGRFANNGWLQEFPDPVTKLTWDNAALLSRRTAEALGVRNDDLVRLAVGGRDVPMPVWIVPGQADFSVTVALGWGRTRAGRIGNARGFNAYRLRTGAAPYIAAGLTVTPLGETYPLACVQDHHGLDEEKLAADGTQERLPMIVREGTLEEFAANPGFAKERVEAPPLRSMWDDHTYESGHQWGMTIDLSACTGCGACTIACQSENNIPIVGKEQVLNGREMHWIRIDRYYRGTTDAPTVLTQPVGCMHCEMAPCEQVCPVAATSHDEEGLNVMTYNRCIGTRYCSNNCPYKARRFNFYNYTKDMPETTRMAMNPDVSVRFRGVMEKCTYCTQRITAARADAKRQGRPLRDGDVAVACEQACPAQAIVFGDINDPSSRVAKSKSLERDYALLGELNVRPRTTYLARINNPNTTLPA